MLKRRYGLHNKKMNEQDGLWRVREQTEMFSVRYPVRDDYEKCYQVLFSV